jgi:signal transduction histidine kinase
MSEVSRLVSSPQDPKGRLISIFAGAVLLPSLALSVMSLNAVPKQAEAMKYELTKSAEKVLGYIEKDLETIARNKALEAARAVGPNKLLDGRIEVTRPALKEAGLRPDIFDSLRLEASSVAKRRLAERIRNHEVDVLREALSLNEPVPTSRDEDAVPLAVGESDVMGMLYFRLACGYVHGELIRDYFEKEFTNPDFVVRVTEYQPSGAKRILYETAPTPSNKFDVKRELTSRSFKGIKLQIRSRERSIDEEIRFWTITKMAMIGLIDLMLGAGLFLVYQNVRREMHLSRLKSDFVANVSHELKTPLALIRLFAETLELGRVSSGDKARQYYRVINKESQRLTQLINNILDFSRIEAGRKEYHFKKTDVGRIVHDVVEAYRFQIEQHGFSLDVQIAEDLPEIELDKEAVSQALINLVNNAIKYSSEEKQIRIEARRDGPRVLIQVKDKGIGIAKAEQRKIFEKFYRAQDTLVHETKGSGLGLSLVKHIMDAHGGSVEVESAPGRGSTFSLALPLARPAP